MTYYAVKNRFSQEILITWENSPAIMLNEKSKIKVVYTVWSFLIPRALWALITELSNLCIWKHARWLYLEDPQASQIQHIHVWTQPFSFFTPKYVSSCILFLSVNGTTIHPATAAKILSLSHSWSPTLNQWLYSAMHLAKTSQFYPLFVCFPPLLWKLFQSFTCTISGTL